MVLRTSLTVEISIAVTSQVSIALTRKTPKHMTRMAQGIHPGGQINRKRLERTKDIRGWLGSVQMGAFVTPAREVEHPKDKYGTPSGGNISETRRTHG